MYLKKSYRKKTGRTYLSIVQKYRDPQKKTSTDRTVISLGYLDELEKEYDDPITHFKEVARQMTEEEKTERNITFAINLAETLPQDSKGQKNLGYVALLKIYHQLRLDDFFKNKARHEPFKYNTNSIMILLVVSRLLSPGSRKKAFAEKHRYFERFNFTLKDIYHSLSHFAKISKEAQKYLETQITKKYGRDTKTIYYNLTNFYFTNDQADEFHKYEKSKEQQHNPLLQMGLAIDANGIPLHYEIFPENKLDKETFRSVIEKVRQNYDPERIVVVADSGIITADNLYYLTEGKNRNGYIFSFPVQGGTKEFKDYILENKGLDGKPATEDAEFKIKSRRITREINVTMPSGKIAKKIIDEKQVVFWAKKPKEEKYEGYYAIVTSELQMSDLEIINIYQGLREIEETFRTRPVFVEDSIAAHFLTSFIALVIIRLLQMLTNQAYSPEEIITCLNTISCSHEQDNLYLFNYRSNLSDVIGNCLGIDFTCKRLGLNEIKNILAKSKK